MMLAMKRFALLSSPDVLIQLLDDIQTQEYHVIIDKDVGSLRGKQLRHETSQVDPGSMEKWNERHTGI
jgi:hypothetical protein